MISAAVSLRASRRGFHWVSAPRWGRGFPFSCTHRWQDSVGCITRAGCWLRSSFATMGSPCTGAREGELQKRCCAGGAASLRAEQPVGAGGVLNIPSSFQCSLIRVTSGTAGAHFWKISLDNSHSVCFEGVDVICMQESVCAGLCLAGVTDQGCSPLCFLHADSSSLFPCWICILASQVLCKILCPANPMHHLQAP